MSEVRRAKWNGMETGVTSTRYCAVVCLFCTQTIVQYTGGQPCDVLPHPYTSVDLFQKFCFFGNNVLSRFVMMFETPFAKMVVPMRRTLQIVQMEEHFRGD